MQVTLAMFLCAGIGLAIVETGCRLGTNLATLTLKACLSAGFGLGAFSVLFLIFRLLGSNNLLAVDMVAAAVLLLCWILARWRTSEIAGLTATEDSLPKWLSGLLLAAFAVALGASLYCAICRTIASPNGDGWDAFAIWNLHARFLFRSGPAWRDGFSSLIPWSHPDYPLLLPAAIAHFWTYLGRESHTVPSIVGLIFTASTAGVLFSGLLTLRGRTIASLGCIALLATPAFIEQGTSQYADVPLSFFMLAAVVLMCLSDALPGELSGRRGLFALAGLSAGFAAWTKNEGLLFLMALVIGRFLASTSSRKRGQDSGSRKTPFSPFLISALTLIFLVIWFKQFVAPPGDLFGNSAVILHKLLGGVRYGVIARWYSKQFLLFGHWLWVPGTVLVAGIFLASRTLVPRGTAALSLSNREREGPGSPQLGIPVDFGFRACVLAIIITLLGYFWIYVITPYDVYWHLRFSLNRLFLQLWPATLFLSFVRIMPGRAPGGSEALAQKES